MSFFSNRSAGGSSRKDYNLAVAKSDIAEKVSGAIMMVDRDFIVTYVNEPTLVLLRANAAAIQCFPQEPGASTQDAGGSVSSAVQD
jgi:hypothetical protein